MSSVFRSGLFPCSLNPVRRPCHPGYSLPYISFGRRAHKEGLSGLHGASAGPFCEEKPANYSASVGWLLDLSLMRPQLSHL